MASARGGGSEGAREILSQNSLALGRDYGSWSFPSAGQADVGVRKSDFILVGFILVKLWQKAEDDKGGFKAFNPSPFIPAFNLHSH